MKINGTIYFDHQATTPVDDRVFAEMAPYFSASFANPHSLDHALGWESSHALEGAAARIGRLIGADTDEIIFTSGATEANNLALLGLGRRATGGKRRRILVSKIEHKCVLAASRVMQEQLGFDVQYLPVDQMGFVDLPALETALTDEVLLVSVSVVNNEIGTIQNISTIAEMVRKSGALLHCDGAQAPCAVDLHRITEGVDLLSLSAHKIYGPKGIGALYIRRDLQTRIEPLIYGGGQQNNLRSGTVPVSLCVGMAAAAALLEPIEAQKERDRLRRLTTRFIQDVQDLPWPVFLNGPEAALRHPGNANLRFEGFEAQDILRTLQPHLAASTGAAYTSGIPEPSHVLRALGMSADAAGSSIRFSLGRETTDQDVRDAARLIEGALSRLSQFDLMRLA